MARNPKSDIVHKHNALLGSVAMAKSAMIAVYNSGSTRVEDKNRASDIHLQLDQLYHDIKTNPQY